jgi:hypothetical protein
MAGINNYTGMLTRSIVFSGALVVFLAASAMTLAALIIPNWISFENETNHGTHIHYTYGLHRRCSNTDSPSYLSVSTNSLHCVGFPQNADCHGSDKYFCSMWRSVAFLMSFAIVIEGMTIVAFAILICGGKQRREQGWGVMAILVGLAAFVQVAAMALIVRSPHRSSRDFVDRFSPQAYLFENDDRFFVGWYLDKSWVMCTISWSLQALCALAITMAALVLPSEGGYELILDHA